MGSELLATGSILAAFLAGGVALFAPCCIVFLAPSYLAAAVKNRRWKLLPLTFVFAAGLAAVLVPITVGANLIAGAIARYHAVLYWAGGLLMIGLAILALSGRMWSMPGMLRAPSAGRSDTATFFSLGVFSGIASSCCAPVLAGVMTLSALSGSPAGGTVLGLAYVFGMVLPLFLMALLWDKLPKGGQSWLRAKPVRLRVAGRILATNTVNLLVAAGFVAMGVAVILQAGATDMTGGGSQSGVAAWLTDLFAFVLQWTAPIPDPVLGAALIGLVAIFVLATLRDRGHDTPLDPPDGGDSPDTTGRAADAPDPVADPTPRPTESTP